MKYIKFLWLLLIFAACKNEPKPTVNPSDTIIFGGEMPPFSESKRVPPPLGMQGGGAGIRDMARAAGEKRYVLENKDTLVETLKVETVTYTTTSSEIKPFIGGPIPPVNKPPTANAGIDRSITLPTNNSQLTGTGADPEQTTLTYSWSKVSGPTSFNIANPNAPVTTVTGLTAGAYSFRLTVTDKAGLTGTDDAIITVNPATPVPPTTGYLSLPLSGLLDLSGQSNVIIENKRFRNISGNAIRVANGSNVIIRNCFFDGSSEESIEIEDASNVTITNCLFARMTCGVYALSSSTIKVNNNQFVNTRMRASGHRGQFVQFNGVGGAGNEIMNNKGEDFDGESNAEDMVSLYGSSGTASSPVRISGNMFRGGCPSTSGGGIIAGDNNGAYTIIENNSVMNPGQYGIAIAGGHDIKILNNKIYSDKTSCSNNPLYLWAQAGAPCSNNTILGNYVNWTDKTGAKNNGWNSGNCGNSNYNPSENKTISKADMNFPVHLIDFVTPAELLIIRK